MGTLFISLLTLVLLAISGFVILIVLMQRTSQNGGMGAALGGGAAESAFGSDTNNMLTKGTIYGIVAFFVCSLGLYLFYQAQAESKLPELDVSALITGAGTAEATTAEATAAEAVSGEAQALSEEASAIVETLETAEAGALDAAEAAAPVESLPAASSLETEAAVPSVD